MDKAPPHTPLPKSSDTAAGPAAPDAATAAARRVALLDAMAEDAQKLARRVRLQAYRDYWVDLNDCRLFKAFGRTLRRSIMLAAKLEAEARRLAPTAQDTAALAASLAGDAATVRRVTLLDAVAEDAQLLGRLVRVQTDRCSWADPKDDVMFNGFGRVMRQSLLLAARLEADALRVAAGEEPVREAAPPERAAAAAADEAEQPRSVDERDRPDMPEKPDPLDRPDRPDQLPDKPVGVLVAGLARDARRPCDLTDFSDADLDFDRERWQRVAAGPQPREKLPMGWIRGMNGQPVKIGTERKDLFTVPPAATGQRAARDPPA